MRDRIQLAYCAGLIDGEGSIGVYPNNCTRRYAATVRLAMNGLDGVERVYRVFGVGNIRSYVRRPPRGRYFCWSIGRQSDVAAVLTALYPYLIVKRREAQLALRFIDGDDSVIYELSAIKHRNGPRVGPFRSKSKPSTKSKGKKK